MWYAIDSHCHIDVPKFDQDRNDVILRAKNAQIALVNSGVNLRSNLYTKRLLEHDNVYATYGLSPVELREAPAIEEFIRHNENTACGIGEVGLDYHHVRDTRQRKKQQVIFQRFIELSQELDLPLIVHSRDAEKQVFQMTHNLETVIYHCYSGDLNTLRLVVDCGHYISIPTKVKKSKVHQQIVKCVPEEFTLVETDSPYLSARKGRNEPSYIIDAILAISQIWGTTADATARILLENTVNALKLY